jgi:hypothetical protein
MRGCFTDAGGISIAGGDALHSWNLTLGLRSWGRSGSLVTVEPVRPVAFGRRVEYLHGPVTEWYLNDRAGFEQGFTVNEPPPGPRGAGPLELGLAVGGGFSIHILSGARDARFVEVEGRAVVQYTGLRAWDAMGRELGAQLSVVGEDLRIRIEDRDALYPVHIDPWLAVEEAKLVAADPDDEDEFGQSIAAFGNTAVVGAWREDPGTGILPDHGSAYVFVRTGTTWSEEAKLMAAAPGTADHFGASAAIAGDTILIGASGDDIAGVLSVGSAFVFVRDGTSWTQQAQLKSSDGAKNDFLGGAVAIVGDIALVGAGGDDTGGPDAGSVYVFERSGTTWTQQQELTASDPSIAFGGSLAVSGTVAAIGAHEAVYVFAYDGLSWTEQAKLTASDPVAGDGFGSSVAILDDLVVVGAPSNSPNPGKAYVFCHNGIDWVEQAKLVASDGENSDAFGEAVATSGDLILIGAPDHDPTPGFGQASAGAAYVFTPNGTDWVEQLEFTSSDAASNDHFGHALALLDGMALVTAFQDGHSGFSRAGSAYVYQLSGPAGSYCTAGTSASGCQAVLSSTGTPSASAPVGFNLNASTVEGAKDGMFFVGTSGKQATPWGNGTSYQCVTPPVKRAGLLTGSGSLGQCDGSFVQDLNALWCPICPKHALNPGSGAVVQAQFWYRDPLSTSNQSTSLSDAIEFEVKP